MPKIIPDLGPRILETAARAFETKGFDATDMKGLAADLGISVGTLYNYYPSKPELFLAVSLLWKQQLTTRMLARLDEGDAPNEQLRAVLWMLYENMQDYTGIWREFLRSGAALQPGSPVGDRFRKENEPLNERLQDLFRAVWKDHPHAPPLLDVPENRLARFMVGSIMQLVMGGFDDAEANRAFVRHWIDFVAPPTEENSHKKGL